MGKKVISVVLLIAMLAMCFCLVGCGDSGSKEPKEDVGAQFITAANLKDKIENGDAIKYVDVQGEAATAHFKGSVNVATPDEITADTLKGFGKSSIIIVSEDGGDVAEAARLALVAAGADSAKMYILEGGMGTFEYPDYIE